MAPFKQDIPRRMGFIHSLINALFGLVTFQPLDWSSPEVISSFQSYWTTDQSYLNASSPDICNQDIPLRWDSHPNKEVHQTYFEAPVADLEEFLAGEVHPIFRRSNWISNLSSTEEAYEAMRPALRVASEFITNDDFLDWWTRVQFGTQSWASPRVVLHDTENLSLEEKRRRVKDEMEKFANKVKFSWFGPGAVPNVPNAIAFDAQDIPTLMKYLGNTQAWLDPRHYQNPYRKHTIGLQVSYHCRLLATKAQNLTLSQDLRFQLVLAEIILHELAHAWYAHWHDKREVLVYGSDVFPEMGFSLKRAIFGAYFLCYDQDGPSNTTPCILPIFSYRIEDSFPVKIPANAAVPVEWVQQWFRKVTWENISTLRMQDKLSVPTISRHASRGHLAYFEDGEIKWKKYTNGELLGTGAEGAIEQLSKGKDHCSSVAERYIPIWRKDAERAFKAGKLPEEYYRPVSYTDKFPNYTIPEWAREPRSRIWFWMIGAVLVCIAFIGKKVFLKD